jgi:hypothetical protein
VSRRDNTSTAGVTDLPITQAELISVKLSRKIGPAAMTRDAFRKMMGQYTETEFTGIVAQQAASGMQLEMLNTALAALRAALKQQSTASYVTEASLGAISTNTLVSGHRGGFGDQASRIKAWVMHSKPYYDLVKNQIAANINGVSNFNVASGTAAVAGQADHRHGLGVPDPQPQLAGREQLHHARPDRGRGDRRRTPRPRRSWSRT